MIDQQTTKKQTNRNYKFIYIDNNYENKNEIFLIIREVGKNII